MEFKSCAQCGTEIDGKGISFRGHAFCSDECCEEYEAAFAAKGGPDDDFEDDDFDEDFDDDFEDEDEDDDLGYREEDDDLDEDDDDYRLGSGGV